MIIFFCGIMLLNEQFVFKLFLATMKWHITVRIPAYNYQNYYYMPRNSRKQVFKCQDHMLALKPIKNNLYFTETISCCFCNEKGATNKSNNGKKETDTCLTCPIFNNDCNHGSPAFILSSQRNYFSQNGQRLQNQHNKKIQHYTDSKSEMCIPKPRSKYNYCSVCRKGYDDYLQHILSSKHKNEIKHSKFNNYILQAARKFKGSQPNQQANSSANTVQEELQIIEGPRKKIKPNPQLQYQKSLPNYQFLSNQQMFPFYGGPMSVMPSMMQNMAMDMNIIYQRQMLNSFAPYYSYGNPYAMNAFMPMFPYSYMPGPISNGPIRASHPFINQNA